ncbi:MAG: CPBP family intramembrane metalloprotease [Kiritimatiellae bacterium]|nr:CPBP family intramembrane metalloprotease [Kiritimatiellia bacterium]
MTLHHRLWIEFLGIYVLLPLSATALRMLNGAYPVLPILWLASLPAALWLVAHGFDRHDFFAWRGLRLVWRGVLLRAVLAAAVMTGLVLLIEPDWLFQLPRTSPQLWLLIMCFYPLVSVYPQGILYRALYYRRYAVLFPHAWSVRLAGAMAFSFCHLFFLNLWALLLTLAGGWFFGRTYERTRSLPVANFEHALYGCLLFTIGLGRFLYHGTMALIER